MRDLATIQRRFYGLVTAGEGVIDPGLLGTSRRLDVYAEAYVARLHDVLADDYPKLRGVLGAERFRELAVAYVRARPPTSFTVRDAGLALPGYLAMRDDVPRWCSELAALERARVEVFDRAEASVLTREDLGAVPVERFPEVVLALVPASVLIRLRWSVDDVWSAIEDDAVPEPPTPCARAVLVWRRDHAVLHRTLDADEAELLQLIERGASLASISERLGDLGHPAPEQRLVALLAGWLDAALLAH